MDKVYEFGSGKVREHLGGIYDFLRNKRMDDLKELDSRKTRDEKQETRDENPDTKDDSAAKKSYEQQKAEAAAKRKREKQIAETEAAISKLEDEQRELETLLADPANQTQTNFQRYDHVKREIEQKMYEWELLSEE